jgi:hypothetical protein
MKIPTLFGRTPKHQRFTFEPRFYDPQKEEREERNRQILRELKNDKNSSTEGYQTRIKGSFSAARKRSQVSSSDLQTSLLRLVILLFLVLFLVAYVWWGSKALYGFLIFVPLYFWMKFRK